MGSPEPATASTALLTDHYELTMLGSALADGTAERPCVFEVFARRLPDGRRYGVVAGTARVLDAIADFRFTDAELAQLEATAVVDDATLAWLAARRPGVSVDELRERVVAPDRGAEYTGGVHTIDLSSIRPMVATPGDPAKGIPSDPTNGAYIDGLGDVRIDIAYGGSCTAGKEDDIDMYARVMQEAARAGKRVADGVDFYIQFGSRAVEEHARKKGYLKVFQETGVKVISPGCGACIGCGPGVSSRTDQVTVSAINRNYQNRSGPGQLYLASPLNVAASAVAGNIVAYEAGMFKK